MKPSNTICVREHSCLLAGGSTYTPNAVSIPISAFNSLLADLHNEKEDSEVQSFLRLTTFQRKPALKVQNYVGVLRTRCGTQIEVLPKLYSHESNNDSLGETRGQLLRMLRTLRDSPFKEAGRADIRNEKMPLLEVYITQFLVLVNQLVKRGIRSDYVRVQENTRFLKGRLLVSKQIRHNTFRQERFFIEYSDYQINRPANRLIKTTLHLVQGLSRISRNQRLALELGFVFEDVPESVDAALDFSKVKTDRSMGYYKEVLDWCRLLLSGQGPTASVGGFNTLTLLYPMERIFENYVAHCLRGTLDEYFSDGHALKTQAAKYSLVERHQGKPIFNLRPDLLVLKDGRNVCVMDTKWKLINASDRSKKYGISQADMYQLYAYGHKYLKGSGPKELMLIYPKTDTFTQPLPLFTYEDGFTLEVVPFDLQLGELITSRVD